MNIYLVRHGETDYNVNNLLQGASDISLNTNGIKQAHILKEKIKNLKFDFIYSSPLQRALTTANILNLELNLPIYTDNNLKERSFGCLEGINGKDYDIKLFWDYNKNYKYKNVETIQDFFKRVHFFLDDIYIKYPDKNILIVTHNGVNIATNCYFNGLHSNINLLDIKLDNCDYRKYTKQ